MDFNTTNNNSTPVNRKNINSSETNITNNKHDFEKMVNTKQKSNSENSISYIKLNDGSIAKHWDCDVLDPNVHVNDKVYKLNYVFRWTKNHMKGKDLEKLRFVGDRLADNCLKSLDQLNRSKSNNGNCHINLNIKQNHDVIKQIFEYRSSNEQINDFIKQISKVPDFVDFDQIKRAQIFYLKNFSLCKVILLNSCLVGGFGAKKIVKTLNCTNYLCTNNLDVVFKRVLETAQMIMDIVKFDQLKPNKLGWESVARVRLMHAQARAHVLKMSKITNKSNSSNHYYSVKEFGIPINQEDLISTILVFGIQVVMGLKKIKHISNDEIEDYLALWRYVAYLLGITDYFSYLDSYKNSLILFESIFMHLNDPKDNGTSQKVAKNVLLAFSNKPPFYLPYKYQICLSRYLIGEEWADSLNLKLKNKKEQTLLTYIVHIHLKFNDKINKFLYLVNKNWYLNTVSELGSATNQYLLNNKKPNYMFEPLLLNGKKDLSTKDNDRNDKLNGFGGYCYVISGFVNGNIASIRIVVLVLVMIYISFILTNIISSANLSA